MSGEAQVRFEKHQALEKCLWFGNWMWGGSQSQKLSSVKGLDSFFFYLNHLYYVLRWSASSLSVTAWMTTCVIAFFNCSCYQVCLLIVSDSISIHFALTAPISFRVQHNFTFTKTKKTQSTKPNQTAILKKEEENLWFKVDITSTLYIQNNNCALALAIKYTQALCVVLNAFRGCPNPCCIKKN